MTRKKPCDHSGILETVQHPSGIKGYLQFFAMCPRCIGTGGARDTREEAEESLRELGQKALKEFQLVENPVLETHNKYTMNSVLGAPYGNGATKMELARMLGEIAANPGVQKKLEESGFKFDHQTISDIVNKTYQQLQEAIVIQNQAPQKPYWIIVSDEGHSAIPVKHFVRAEADREAQRLTELKPGITFTVFEAKTSLFTPKADTKKTEFKETIDFYNPYPLRANAMPYRRF